MGLEWTAWDGTLHRHPGLNKSLLLPAAVDGEVPHLARAATRQRPRWLWGGGALPRVAGSGGAGPWRREGKSGRGGLGGRRGRWPPAATGGRLAGAACSRQRRPSQVTLPGSRLCSGLTCGLQLRVGWADMRVSVFLRAPVGVLPPPPAQVLGCRGAPRSHQSWRSWEANGGAEASPDTFQGFCAERRENVRVA